MLWLTWRQHRTQLLLVTGLLVGLGAFLLVHGLRNADLAAQLAADRAALERTLGERFRPVNDVLGWLPLAPALFGLFWGAPLLAREFDRGTHKLVWTQSVSRRRWLAVKIGTLSAVVVLAGLAFGAMVNMWLASFGDTRYAYRFGNVGTFEITGVLPAVWWLFAFITGVAAGAVLRRTMPAIGVTVAVVLVVVLGTFFLDVRSYYVPAERIVLGGAAAATFPLSNDLLIRDTGFIGSDGRDLPTDQVYLTCQAPEPSACLLDSGARQVFYYHSANRYWRFQLTEAAILLAGTVLLGAVAVNRAARRRI